MTLQAEAEERAAAEEAAAAAQHASSDSDESSSEPSADEQQNGNLKVHTAFPRQTFFSACSLSCSTLTCTHELRRHALSSVYSCLSHA